MLICYLIKDIKYAFSFKNIDNKSEKIKISDIKIIIPYIKCFKNKFILTFSLILLLSLLTLPSPYLIKIIIDDAITKKNINLLLVLLAVIAGVQLFQSILSMFLGYISTVLNQKILLSLKSDLFNKLLRLPFSFFDNKQSGYLTSRIHEVSGISFFFSPSILSLLVSFSEFIFSLFILCALAFKLTLIVLFLLPVYYVIVRIFRNGLRAYSRDTMEVSAQLNRQMQESFAGIEVVKTNVSEDREMNKLSGKMNELFSLSIRQSIFSGISSRAVGLFTSFLGLFILFYFGKGIIYDNFTIGTYIAFSGYMAKLFGPVQLLTSMGFSLQPALVSLQRVNELFSQISEDADPKRVLSLTHIKGKIQFDNVIFSYNTEPVLHNISIKFKEGEKIALVGPTGSGKSTTVKLILGFYNPTKGDIYIDGNNIKLIKLSSLRDRISIISQNIFLFNDTVRNNILYSRYKSTEDELLYAANVSGVTSFLNDLPEGLETVVGEKGTRLSGGQKQMISIARAILKKPDILILDEATSHLDGLREAFLQKVILEDFKDKTCIIISHRLSSVSLAYRCFVYDSGRIVQEGHYTELIEREGKFRELFKNQHAASTI